MRTSTVQALKSRNDFGARAKELASAIEAARLSITAPAALTVAQEANKWAKRQSEIRRACSARTDEEINLYACMALASWESR